MSIKDILSKHGGKALNKEGWFEVKDPTLEDVKRIAAKGRLEEAGFRIPLELRRYLDISSEEGELIKKQAIPEELRGLADETIAAFKKVKDNVK